VQEGNSYTVANMGTIAPPFWGTVMTSKSNRTNVSDLDSNLEECSLAGVPPYGVKTDAICWQSNATSGDAQCTYNCVDVTAANGTTFFPLVSLTVKFLRGTLLT
jgi:hypothetical protein